MFPGFADNLHDMATLHFTVLVAVLGGAALYLFYLIWRNLHRARIIEDTPTAKVRSAPQGYVELEGGARPLPGKTAVAPLTGSPCVWYRFRIEEARLSGRAGSSNWSTVESGASESPFLFRDATGECLVDPRGAEVTPGARKVWHGSTRWPGQADRRGLLSALIARRYRYTEERIDAGMIYVLGWFETLRGAEVSARAEAGRLLRHWKQAPQSLLRQFDVNGDGLVDAAEWQAAREQAHRQVLQDRATRPATAAVSCIRASGHDRYPYLISARPQRALTDCYRRRAILTLLGAVAVTATLVWVLAARH